jgi:hypothetical protein
VWPLWWKNASGVLIQPLERDGGRPVPVVLQDVLELTELLGAYRAARGVQHGGVQADDAQAAHLV